MLDIADARLTVLQKCVALPAEITALMSTSLGLTLAEDVRADLDSPPFNKSMMDGYAVRAADCNQLTELELLEEISAGMMPKRSVGSGHCSRIFTGAPIPEGADSVVMIEMTEIRPNGRIRVLDPGFPSGRHIIPRGQEMKAGDVIIPLGTTISPITFGLFASCGKTAVSCIPAPRVTIISTGDEVVEPNMKPRGAQIRNSNGPMLVAQTVRAGAVPHYLGIGRDTEQMLSSLIQEGMSKSHVVVLAGGVSAGKLDLVPSVLESLGVTIHFHKVRMKPGKPLLFGSKDNVLVFGLPGNPVSSYVGFEVFVRPALDLLAGRLASNTTKMTAKLQQSFQTTNDRPTYHPSIVNHDGVSPVHWTGSADLRSLLNANSFLVLPAGDVSFKAGDSVSVMPIA